MVPAPLISTPSRVAIVYCSGQATLSRDPAMLGGRRELAESEKLSEVEHQHV